MEREPRNLVTLFFPISFNQWSWVSTLLPLVFSKRIVWGLGFWYDDGMLAGYYSHRKKTLLYSESSSLFVYFFSNEYEYEWGLTSPSPPDHPLYDAISWRSAEFCFHMSMLLLGRLRPQMIVRITNVNFRIWDGTRMAYRVQRRKNVHTLPLP